MHRCVNSVDPKKKAEQEEVSRQVEEFLKQRDAYHAKHGETGKTHKPYGRNHNTTPEDKVQ